jgi:hypothetical protein
LTGFTPEMRESSEKEATLLVLNSAPPPQCSPFGRPAFAMPAGHHIRRWFENNPAVGCGKIENLRICSPWLGNT